MSNPESTPVVSLSCTSSKNANAKSSFSVPGLIFIFEIRGGSPVSCGYNPRDAAFAETLRALGSRPAGQQERFSGIGARFSPSIQRFTRTFLEVGLSTAFAERHNHSEFIRPLDTHVAAFASIDRPCLRIALWLAISISAVVGRPLHELEHAPDSRTGAAQACSCSRLHSTVHFQPVSKPAAGDYAGHRDSGRPDTGDNHQHSQCQICLTLWLQTPFQVISPEVQSREVPEHRLPFSDDQAGCSTPQSPNARGPPVVA